MSQTEMKPVELFVTKDGLALIEGKKLEDHVAEDGVECLLLFINERNYILVKSCIEMWHLMLEEEFEQRYKSIYRVTESTLIYAVIECLVGVRGV
jgi:hypothetical protein